MCTNIASLCRSFTISCEAYSNEWDKAHNASWEQCLMMQGLSHYQGSHSLGKYTESWVHALFYLV
jgi:hypothetical protein